MTATQPLPVLVSGSQPPVNPETSRLLSLWAELAVKAASSSAHGTADEEPLRELQTQVEDALLDRSLITKDVLDELIAWESTLLHHAPQSPPEDCLLCRKSRLEIPFEMPLPVPVGGGR
jgi:hypothetical protein